MGSVRWSEVESSHYPYLTEFEKKKLSRFICFNPICFI
jgi:hypothetical protein